MTNEEIAQLKADNERLNKIIGIVVEQNELLKLENAFLKKAVTPKDIINSFAKIGMAIKSNENALAKLDDEPRTRTNDMLNYKDGNNNSTEGMIKIKDGISNSTRDLVESKDGNNNSTEASVKINNGNSNTTEGIVTFKEGNNKGTGDMVNIEGLHNNVTEVMPATIDASGSIIGTLEKELKASGYNRISHSGVNNAAKLLIHFYNKGNGSYPELQKITGHSTDGIAKFIMSMKKRGWIHRFGFQQFGLTDNGVALIKQALTKSREN